MRKLLASATSRKASGKRSRRWTELEVYARDGGFTVLQRGNSVVEGEDVRESETDCVDVDGVFSALLFNGRLTDTATEVLERAAAADARFAAALGDRHEVEDLDVTPASVSLYAPADYAPITIERDGDRALRFVGKRIGFARSRNAGETHLEVSVFATTQGRFVLQKAQVADFDRDNPRRTTVWVVDDAADAIGALSRPSTGWLESQVIEALRDAARNDERFAKGLGDRLDRRVHSVRELVDDVPRVGQALKRILEALADGDQLIEDLELGESAGVRWARADVQHLPRLPRQVFVTLCRRRLLQRAGVTPTSQTWVISELGRKAIRR